MRRRRSLGGGFSPLKLFASGAKGAWYAPDDFSTLFQDAFGQTPVTAVEQPVRFILDKAQGLVLGSELVTNGDFATDTAWTKGATTTISGGSANFLASTGFVLYKGSVSGIAVGGLYEVTFTVTNYVAGSVRVYLGATPTYGATVSANGTYTARFGPTAGSEVGFNSASAFTGSIDNVSVKAVAGNHARAPNDASRPMLRARYNNFVATTTLATQNVTTSAASYKLTFTGAGTITLSGTNVGVYSAGTNTITCTAGTLTATVAGTVTNADLRLSSTATSMPAYQLVTTSTNYDTIGFLPYLALDGTDDSFATNSIDFSATNKMAVVAGVTKLSDAAQAAVAELSATIAANNGSFLLSAPNSAAANFNFSSKGTTQVDNTVTTYASPYTAVLAGSGDIAGGTNSIKVNGGTATTVTSSQGTGNYGNYSLYIGRRNNATLPFNGRLYQMIICGKTLSASELASTEAYVNIKTGAY